MLVLKLLVWYSVIVLVGINVVDRLRQLETIKKNSTKGKENVTDMRFKGKSIPSQI